MQYLGNTRWWLLLQGCRVLCATTGLWGGDGRAESSRLVAELLWVLHLCREVKHGQEPPKLLLGLLWGMQSRDGPALLVTPGR